MDKTMKKNQTKNKELKHTDCGGEIVIGTGDVGQPEEGECLKCGEKIVSQEQINKELSKEELLEEFNTRIESCCESYGDSCLGTKNEGKCKQWQRQIRAIIKDYPLLKEVNEFVDKRLKKKSFSECFYNFMASPEGLSSKEICKELENSGIDTKKLQKRVEKILHSKPKESRHTQDDKWVEEKASEMLMVILQGMKKDAIDFIRNLLLEVQPKVVSEEEFQAEAEKLFDRSKSFKVLYDAQVYLSAMLKKLGVEVKK